MNFFQAQDNARRNTLWLILLFLAAVAAIIAVIYLCLHFALSVGSPPAEEFRINDQLLLDTAVGVLAMVAVGSLYKALILSGGGDRIAQSLGGRLIELDTRDAGERQLMNIVEEMAIAAGAPVPNVYLLPDGHINAFAAGTTLSNAVIGVSRGALTHLNREQMQGVIAHEFSHIINGDMRINIRMIAVIHGIMLLGYLGYFLMRGGMYTSNRNSGGIILLGAVLAVTGFIGTFFGSWIRAAVSRQREYLADAAAVQYTRAPHGIAGALERIGQLSGDIKTIGGDTPEAQQHKKHRLTMLNAQLHSGGEEAKQTQNEYCHLFFSNLAVSSFSNPFATHPPLQDRIRRIMPQWDENHPINTAPAAAEPPPPAEMSRPRPAAAAGIAAGHPLTAAYNNLFGGSGAAGIAAAAVTGQIGNINAASVRRAAAAVEKIPKTLASAAHNPQTARALIYVMLLDKKDPDIAETQLRHLEEHADTGVYDLTIKLKPEIHLLRPEAMLPLVQCCLPALRLLSRRQYELFLSNMAAMQGADRAVDLFEWCIQALLVHALHDHFIKKRRRAVRGNKMQAQAYALSVLARVSQEAPQAAVAAAAEQTRLLVTYSEKEFEPQALFDSMQVLSAMRPVQKERFARAAALCAAHNGFIDNNEATLLRAYFMIIDCPLPLSLAEDAGSAAAAEALPVVSPGMP